MAGLSLLIWGLGLERQEGLRGFRIINRESNLKSNGNGGVIGMYCMIEFCDLGFRAKGLRI